MNVMFVHTIGLCIDGSCWRLGHIHLSSFTESKDNKSPASAAT